MNEYSWFVEETRKNAAVTKSLDEAIDRAIDDMPDDFQLKHFLTTHRKEVGEMLLTEYDEEEELRLSRLEGKREGLEEGKAEGETNTRLESIRSIIEGLNYTAEQAMQLLKIPEAEWQKYIALL